MAAQGKQIPTAVTLLYSVGLFLLGFLPAVLIYWVGGRICESGHRDIYEE
jgi:hypothetical protein